MKKKKIILTVIKEADGGFSAIGYAGKNNQDLIAAQGDTWEKLKEMALDAVNLYLKNKDKAPVTINEVNFSFDLPSFFDAYPQMSASALAKQTVLNKSLLSQSASGKKNASDRQVHRILAAVKQLGSGLSHAGVKGI